MILASADEVVARVRVSRRNPGPVEVDSAAARKRKLDFLGEDPATPAGGVPETGDPSQVAAAKPEGMAENMFDARMGSGHSLQMPKVADDHKGSEQRGDVMKQEVKDLRAAKGH